MTHEEKRARRKAIAREAEAGDSLPELVERHGLSERTIAYCCWEAGVKAPSIKVGLPGNKAPASLRVLACLKRSSGDSLQAIGRECAVSREYVRQVKAAADKLGLLAT